MDYNIKERSVWGIRISGIKRKKSVWGINISGIERKGGYGGLKYLELKGKKSMAV